MLFLQKCITENVIPNSLKLDLQQTIGNHGKEFLTCWYGKLQTFSKEFLKDIVNFCKTTISKLANKIKETENELIQLLEKETYEQIKETINTNQNIRDRTLRKRKQKKFHQLKFKPRQPQKYDLVEKEDTPTETFNSKSANEKSYASAARRGKSKTDLQSKRSNKNLKRTLSKNNFLDKNQASIMQQLDIRTNEQSRGNNQATSSIKETMTTENNTQYKEMQDQIKQLTSEITKLKAMGMNDESISSGNIQEATIQTIPTPPTTSSPRKH